LSFLCVVSSEVHLVQKQLTQAENDNAALRTDKEKLETRAGQLVRHAVLVRSSLSFRPRGQWPHSGNFL